MARRRRVRVAVGFGAGGRTALLQSLVPTASEKAEADRAKRAVDNAKIAAFNREEITIEELTAYFNERKSQAGSDVERTEIQALIDNATASDKKKKSVKAYNSAVNALADYKNGQGSYDDAVTAIKAARDQVTDQEQRVAIDRLVQSAGQIKTERVVNSAVEDYNAGRLDYNGLKTKLSDVQAKETNEQIKGAITKSLDAARAEENKKVMNRATTDYNAGRINVAEFEARLTALRDAPDQKNPDTVTQINAAIAMAKVNEQGLEDQRAYNRWVQGQADDATTKQYFNNRLATETNAKVLDNLGQYAANIQKAIAANAEKAAGLARAQASRSSTTADNQLKAADDRAITAMNEYDENVFKLKWQRAKDTHNPYLAVEAYNDRARELREIAPSAGTKQAVFMNQANDMERTGKIMASAIEIERLAEETKGLKETARALDKDKTATPEQRVAAWQAVGRAAIRSEQSGWLVDPSQVKFTTAIRTEVAAAMQDAINDERAKQFETTSDAGRQISGLWTDLRASGSLDRVLKAAGISKEEVETAEGKKKFSTWLQADPETRVLEVLKLTNAGQRTTTNAQGEVTNIVSFEKIDELAETIIENIRTAQQGAYGKTADLIWAQTYILNPQADRYATQAFMLRSGRDETRIPPVALPNPDGSYTHLGDPSISAGEWWETATSRPVMNDAAAIDEGSRSGESSIDPTDLIPDVGAAARAVGGVIGGIGGAITEGAKKTTFDNILQFGADAVAKIGDAWEGFVWRNGQWVTQAAAAGIDAAASQTMSPLEGTPGYTGWEELNASLQNLVQPGFSVAPIEGSPEQTALELGAPQLAPTPTYDFDWSMIDEGAPSGGPELNDFSNVELPSTWQSWDDGSGNTIQA